MSATVIGKVAHDPNFKSRRKRKAKGKKKRLSSDPRAKYRGAPLTHTPFAEALREVRV